MNGTDEIIYKMWLCTDRTLQMITSSTEEFVEPPEAKLQQHLPHSFLATQQSLCLAKQKKSLVDNGYLVLCNFIKTFVFQDEMQGFH